MVQVKTVKDASVARDDVYKSSTIHTGPGESPNSVSKPTPRGKRIPGKPITKGKLIKPGAPGGGPSRLAQQRPAAQASRPVAPQAAPAPAAQSSRPVPQPVAALSNGAGAGHARNTSTSSVSSGRAPPPPPPPPAAAAAKPAEPVWKAKYDFNGQTASELSFKAGEVLMIVNKEGNGWWLASRKSDPGASGWVPEQYLEEERAAPPPPPPPPAARSVPVAPAANGTAGKKAAPPAPPAKRPARGKPAAPAAPPRDSGYSADGAQQASAAAAGGGGPSMAGGLAAALKQRQAAMSGKREEEEEDW